MKHWIDFAAENAIIVINGLALLIIVGGTVEAFLDLAHRIVFRSSRRALGETWSRYLHWLIAALTFQLAADIIESSIAPTWQDLGQLAAIAVIRTFLNFFLERDLAEYRHPSDNPDAHLGS